MEIKNIFVLEGKCKHPDCINNFTFTSKSIIHLLSQVSNSQTIIATPINTLTLERDLEQNVVEIEALDVPGKADAAVGDASASSIESSAGVVSLGAEEG